MLGIRRILRFPWDARRKPGSLRSRGSCAPPDQLFPPHLFHGFQQQQSTPMVHLTVCIANTTTIQPHDTMFKNFPESSSPPDICIQPTPYVTHHQPTTHHHHESVPEYTNHQHHPTTQPPFSRVPGRARLPSGPCKIKDSPVLEKWQSHSSVPHTLL